MENIQKWFNQVVENALENRLSEDMYMQMDDAVYKDVVEEVMKVLKEKHGDDWINHIPNNLFCRAKQSKKASVEKIDEKKASVWNKDNILFGSSKIPFQKKTLTDLGKLEKNKKAKDYVDTYFINMAECDVLGCAWGKI